jgi:hypothetical protein
LAEAEYRVGAPLAAGAPEQVVALQRLVVQEGSKSAQGPASLPGAWGIMLVIRKVASGAGGPGSRCFGRCVLRAERFDMKSRRCVRPERATIKYNPEPRRTGNLMHALEPDQPGASRKDFMHQFQFISAPGFRRIRQCQNFGKDDRMRTLFPSCAVCLLPS